MARCAICDKGAHLEIMSAILIEEQAKMWKSNIKSVKVKTETEMQRKCMFVLPA